MAPTRRGHLVPGPPDPGGDDPGARGVPPQDRAGLRRESLPRDGRPHPLLRPRPPGGSRPRPRPYAIAAPVLHILYPIPKVVLLPILLVLLGLGDAAKVALMAITVFFQVLVGVRDAAANVPAEAVDAAASLGADRWITMRHLIVPAVLPELFTALRQGMGTCVAILFLSEAIAGSTGLGYFIVDAWGMLDYPRMFAGIVGMGVLGAGLYELMVGVEWALTPWRRAGRGSAARPARGLRGRC
ncbi:MAG: ABC transporter permease subunit [Collinsella sp.]|nr:ABC transporter permease subunit [Collinsella sp.]